MTKEKPRIAFRAVSQTRRTFPMYIMGKVADVIDNIWMVDQRTSVAPQHTVRVTLLVSNVALHASVSV